MILSHMDIPEYPFPASSSGLTSLRPYPTPRQSAPPPPQTLLLNPPSSSGSPEISRNFSHLPVNWLFGQQIFWNSFLSTCPWIDCSVNKFENHFFPLPSPSCPKLPLATTTNKWIFWGVALNHPELFWVKFCTVGKFFELQMQWFFWSLKFHIYIYIYIYKILFLNKNLGGLWGVLTILHTWEAGLVFF